MHPQKTYIDSYHVAKNTTIAGVQTTIYMLCGTTSPPPAPSPISQAFHAPLAYEVPGGRFSYLITVPAQALDGNTAEARNVGGRLSAHLAHFKACFLAEIYKCSMYLNILSSLNTGYRIL